MIDPSISLQTRPLQVDNPIESYGKALSLKALMMHNQVAGQNIADTQRLRQIYQDPTAQDPASLRDLLYKSGVPGGVSAGVALDKDVLANTKANADVQETLGKVKQQKNALESQLAGAMVATPPEQRAAVYPQFVKKWNELGLSGPSGPGTIESEQWNDSFLPHLSAIAARGLTQDQQVSKSQQDWERQWKLSQPQSDYGRTLSDVERMQNPNFQFNSVGSGVQPAGQSAMPVTSTDVTDQSSGATLRPAAPIITPTPLQQPGTEPTTAPPVGVSGRDNATLALWHSSGGKAPEGTVPYVENGEVKFKVDPAWLQGKKDIARAGASIITQNSGPKAFLGKFGDNMADQLSTEQKGAQKAAVTIPIINKMRTELDNGMYTGGFAERKTGLVNMLNGLGIPVDEKTLANTQAFKSFVGTQLLAHAKDLGTNPSNADAVRIDKIIGNIEFDPNALRKIMDFNEDMARKAIDQFNTHYNQVKKDPNAQFGFDMTVNQPPKYKSGLPGAGVVPPPEQRTAGDIYTTPKGKLRWSGTGWTQP